MLCSFSEQVMTNPKAVIVAIQLSLCSLSRYGDGQCLAVLALAHIFFARHCGTQVSSVHLSQQRNYIHTKKEILLKLQLHAWNHRLYAWNMFVNAQYTFAFFIFNLFIMFVQDHSSQYWPLSIQSVI